MSKLLHSTTQSYTEANKDKPNTLGRGLWDPTEDQPLRRPEELPKFLSEEDKLVLRQTIAVLDKVIAKSRQLKGISSDVYVHRVKLGNALWDLLEQRFREGGANDADIAALKRRWVAKVHPYAKYEVDTDGGGNDNNLAEILDREDAEGKPSFRDALRKWDNAFWPSEGQPIDHGQIAKKIFDHLTDQEVTIKEGKPREDRRGRPKTPPATGDGLMVARGKAASTSANDPRSEPKKLKNTWEDDQERAAEKKSETDQRPDAQQWYFRNGDVARDIYEGVVDVKGRNAKVFNAWFGDKTYEHFKALGGFGTAYLQLFKRRR